jgi:hypothetical protein
VAVRAVAVQLGIVGVADFDSPALAPPRCRDRIASRAAADDEFRRRPPRVAGGIDVTFARRPAEDDALRISRPATLAEVRFRVLG